MVDVVTDIVINQPIEVVSNYATDPDHAAEWYVNIHAAEWKTPKPLAIGSQIAFKANFLRRELTYVYEIIEYEPQRKLVMKTVTGPFPMETTYTWQDLDEVTHE